MIPTEKLFLVPDMLLILFGKYMTPPAKYHPMEATCLSPLSALAVVYFNYSYSIVFYCSNQLTKNELD